MEELCLASCPNHYGRKYQVNDKNQIHTPTHPIFIQTEDKNILIDTGIGNGKLSEKQQRNSGVTMKVSFKKI